MFILYFLIILLLLIIIFVIFYFSDNVKIDCAAKRIIIEDESEEEKENIVDINYDNIYQNIPSTSHSSPKEKLAISRNNVSVKKRRTLH